MDSISGKDNIDILDLWVMKTCILVGRYPSFGGTQYLHQAALKAIWRT